MTRVAIAAAGSGGHVYPALAVADELVSRGVPQRDVVFFGGNRMEASVVPDAGYDFRAVDIHGIRRSLSLDNVTLPMKVIKARNVIASEMQDRRSEVMVVFGGYVAGPAALAAGRSSVPLLVHEANAVPGLANKMIAKRSDTTFVAFEPALETFTDGVLIGSPLRGAFKDFDTAKRRPSARARYELSDDAVVLGVVGGSLGAQYLNTIAESLATASGRTFTILHVTGSAHHDAVEQRARGVENWITIPYEETMPDLYAASDLILARGGALTVSELQATRTPAVVVPLPAGKGYQALNARDLERSGGAVVLEQDGPIDVGAQVVALMSDRIRREKMARATYAVDHRKAAEVVADKIVEVSHA